MEKVEYFLYDILGLCIPGFVVILTLDFRIDFISTIIELLVDIPKCCFAFLFGAILLITCYIVGSLLKIISKYLYKIMQRIFDECINKFINSLKSFTYIKKELKLLLGDDLYELVAKIFVFKVQKLGAEFKEYYNKIKEKIDIKTGPKRIDDNQNDFDYDIYKLAQIIAMNNSIKTHSNLFLAKYHLYKLLACWSFLYIFIVIIYNYNFSHPILLILGLIITFIAFNEKYKLYKELNGNELIMALYFFLYKDTFQSH